MPERDLFGDVPAPAPRPRQSRQPASPPQHTWFFAVRPSVADAARIDALAEKLLASHGIVGKRIGPERLHITLELVGHDVDESVVDAACRAADLLRLPAIDVRFDAATTFSAPSGPFVLLGVDGLDEVRKLRTALGCALADHGFTPARAYEPHMTLCYDPRNRVERISVDPIGFQIAEFALVKSHIGLSRHEVLRVWPLNG
jgi:2'-5' RNA ligase